LSAILSLAATLLSTCSPILDSAWACTTTIVTPGASADGSVFVSHSDDADLADSSIVYVPARDWPKGSTRPVYPSAVAASNLPIYNALLVPRIVDADRAPGYAHNGAPRTVPLGEIPQAEHTYAYLDGNYGIVNEHGLMFGECTDGVKDTPGASPLPGKRMFYSSELSRVALERCKTAREAIALIGELIETYGYYGTGETLPMADAKEGWVMEMAPSPEGDGGLWVAQRVPDGHFFIAANEFRIRDLDPKNPDQMIGKRTIEIIEQAGWRTPSDKGKNVDWLASVSLGEYNHPYYSLRRVWRGLSLAAPSLSLDPWVENGLSRAYPFSVKPDTAMTLDDIKRIHRDHYEGTQFDMTKGAAAGPFGNPTRYFGPQDGTGDVENPDRPIEGAWERPISMFYTDFVSIAQLKPYLPSPINVVAWIALDTPAESAFIPLAVAPVPESYENGDTTVFDWNSAWRIYNLVAEYANIKYSYMIKDIRARAERHEAKSLSLVNSLEAKLSQAARENPAAAIGEFSSALAANAEEARLDWKKLFEELVVKYDMGFINSPDNMAAEVGYSDEWLKSTDYFSGPSKYERPE
jgi:dipeptidase